MPTAEIAVRVSLVPVAGSAEGFVEEVGEPPGDGADGLPADGVSQVPEVSPCWSLFWLDVISQAELAADDVVDGGEDDATVVAGEEVVGVKVDVGADVDGAVVVEVEVGTDGTLLGVVVGGVVVVVVQTSTSAFGWAVR